MKPITCNITISVNVTPMVICVLACVAMIILYSEDFNANDQDNVSGNISPLMFHSTSFKSSLMLSVGVCFPVVANMCMDCFAFWMSEKSTEIFKYDVGFITQILIVCSIIGPNIAFMYGDKLSNVTALYWLLIHIQSLVIMNAAFYFIHKHSCFTNKSKTNSVDNKMRNIILLASLLVSALHVVHYCAIYAPDSSKDHYQIVTGVLGGLSYGTSGYICAQAVMRYRKDYFDSVIIPDNLISVQFMALLQVWFSGLAVFFVLTQFDAIKIHGNSFGVIFTYLVTSFALALLVAYGRRNHHLAVVAENALEMKSQFVRHVSHEIRTPLNTTVLGLKLLAEEIAQEETQVAERDDLGMAELIGDVNNAALTAVDILNDLLLYEKIEGGLADLERSEQKAWDFVLDVLRMFRIQAKSLNIDLTWPENPLEGVYVDIDRYKLSQVVRNLVSNALKFSPEHGTVTVAAELLGANNSSPKRRSSVKFKTAVDQVFPHVEMCRISVTDSGAGISKEDQKRLFHEIVQFNAAKLQKGQGSGLGLWISNSIVNMHGGHIGVFSEGENAGSTFYIDIPVSRKERAPLPAIDEASSAQYLRMLSASDDSTHSHTTASIFTRGAGPKGNTRSSSKTTSTTHTSYSSGRVGASASNISVNTTNPNSTIGIAAPPSESPQGSPIISLRRELIETFTPTEKRLKEARENEKRNQTLNTSRHSINSNHSNHSNSSNRHRCMSDDVVELFSPEKEKSIHIGKKHLNKSVLIVDDSSTNRRLVSRLLRDKIGTREEAVNGLEAVARVRESREEGGKRFDIILMDYMMPEMDGPTATMEIRSLGYTGIIIGVTGNGSETDINVFRHAGADSVLIKPLDADHFWHTICELIANGSDSPNQV